MKGETPTVVLTCCWSGRHSQLTHGRACVASSAAADCLTGNLFWSFWSLYLSVVLHTNPNQIQQGNLIARLPLVPFWKDLCTVHWSDNTRWTMYSVGKILLGSVFGQFQSRRPWTRPLTWWQRYLQSLQCVWWSLLENDVWSHEVCHNSTATGKEHFNLRCR